MNIQSLIVAASVLAALIYLLRPWWRRVRARSLPVNKAPGETGAMAACGACKGCGGPGGGCH